MRSFNKIRSTFWGSGETGRLLRTQPESTKLLAIWMFTNDRALAEPWGLYHCPRTLMAEGPNLTQTKVAVALGTLAELGFAFHDTRTEWLWVVSMASEQVLTEGRPLKGSDHMVTAANKWYARCPRNPFLGPFFDRYVTLLHLDERRDGGEALTVGPVVKQPALLEMGEPAATVTSLAERRGAEFDLFWAAYHRKGKSSRSKARDEWMKRKPPAEAVMAGLARWQTSQRWQEGFVVDAARFLKEERWLENPEQALAPGMSERTRDVVEALTTEGSIFDLEPAPVKRLKEG